MSALLRQLRQEDPEFEARATPVLARPPYELSTTHPLVTMLGTITQRHGLESQPTGLSFWTDAAILGQAGVPTVLFGPRGAGLHSSVEFVDLDSVLTCQAVLVDLARTFCEGASE